MTEPAFRILTVCTGNICRSPVVERLLAAELGDGVEVGSAGTRAMVGDPSDPGMVTHLNEAGRSADGFAARQLRPRHLREADLVLALTRAHRARIVEEVPAVLRRTFTLLEFARIVSSPELPRTSADTPAEALRGLVAVAARHRSLGVVEHDDDVPDPYRQGAAALATSYRLIADAVAAIGNAVRAV